MITKKIPDLREKKPFTIGLSDIFLRENETENLFSHSGLIQLKESCLKLMCRAFWRKINHVDVKNNIFDEKFLGDYLAKIRCK